MKTRPTYGTPRPNLPAMAQELFDLAWRYARICCPPDASHEALVSFADELLTSARMRVLTREPLGMDLGDAHSHEGTVAVARAVLPARSTPSYVRK